MYPFPLIKNLYFSFFRQINEKIAPFFLILTTDEPSISFLRYTKQMYMNKMRFSNAINKTIFFSVIFKNYFAKKKIKTNKENF